MDDITKIKSLKIVRTPYIQLLTKYVPHRNYFDSFLCAQTPSICKEGPSKSDLKISKSYLKFDVPYPVSEPDVKPITADPCFELVKKKTTFLNKLSLARRKYQCDKDWLTKKRILSGKVEFIPDYLYDLTNGDYADPDIFFKCKYDYYYAGGNLCKIRDNDETAVIYSDVNGNIFCTNTKTEETTELTNRNGGIIYNIKSFKNKYLTVRQKSRINIMKVKYKRGQYTASTIWELNNTEYPFIDVDFLNSSEICYTDAKSNLKIMDLEQGICKLEHEFDVGNKDKLLLVKYLEPDILSVMGRDFISIFDSRSASSSVFRAPRTFFHCNSYCGFSKSVSSDYLYVATKHNVLKFDLRTRGIVKKWTHFMTLDPVIVKSGIYGNEELLCVGGFMETVCFPTGSGNFMPVQLMKPTIAFDECKLRKKMVVREDLDRRFRMGIVGAEFVKTDTNKSSSNYAYFTCNSVGDTFRHNIINRLNTEKTNIISPSKELSQADNNLSVQSLFNTQTTSDNMTKFIEWVDSVPELRYHKVVSSIINNKAVKRYLLNQQQQENEEDENDEREDKLNSLLGYIDEYQNHNLASIWETDTPMDVDGVLTSVTPQNKVSDWLLNTHQSVDSIKEEV